MKLVLLGFFGMLGVFARYFIGLASTRVFPSGFPYGTFIINLTGCLAIGIVYALGYEKPVISHDMRLVLMTGFLGGYTTFSAFGLESFLLFKNSNVTMGLVYLILSPILGFATRATANGRSKSSQKQHQLSIKPIAQIHCSWR